MAAAFVSETTISIPYIAVNKLLGKEIPWSESREEKSVTYIESPLVL